MKSKRKKKKRCWAPREDDDEISTQIKGGILVDSNLFGLDVVVQLQLFFFYFQLRKEK